MTAEIIRTTEWNEPKNHQTSEKIDFSQISETSIGTRAKLEQLGVTDETHPANKYDDDSSSPDQQRDDGQRDNQEYDEWSEALPGG